MFVQFRTWLNTWLNSLLDVSRKVNLSLAYRYRQCESVSNQTGTSIECKASAAVSGSQLTPAISFISLSLSHSVKSLEPSFAVVVFDVNVWQLRASVHRLFAYTRFATTGRCSPLLPCTLCRFQCRLVGFNRITDMTIISPYSLPVSHQTYQSPSPISILKLYSAQSLPHDIDYLYW